MCSLLKSCPYINEQGDLIVPIDSPARYHYWKDGGLPIAKILSELNASPETLGNYTKRAE
jgi:hypothetical protein